MTSNAVRPHSGERGPHLVGHVPEARSVASSRAIFAPLVPFSVPPRFLQDNNISTLPEGLFQDLVSLEYL